jgi:hypothetical protein
MSFLYLEFLLPIKHYFSTLNKNETVFDLIIPIIFGIIGVAIGLHLNIFIDKNNSIEFFKTLITLLSILIGFSITSLTIIASTSKLTDTLMSVSTERKIGYNKINLYQLMNITFIFALFSEIFTLILNLCAVLLVSSNIILDIKYVNIIILIDIILITHIFLINIRNITNFYFVFHKASSV